MIAPLQEKLTSIEAVQARDEPAQVGCALRASISLEVRALVKGCRLLAPRLRLPTRSHLRPPGASARPACERVAEKDLHW